MPCRAKAKPAFRFQPDQVPDLSQIVAVDKENISQLRLKRATHTVTLLPQDMHFKVRQRDPTFLCLPPASKHAPEGQAALSAPFVPATLPVSI